MSSNNVNATNKKKSNNKNTKKNEDRSAKNKPKIQTKTISNDFEKLVPLSLIFSIILCSGIQFSLSLRDFLSTGRPILSEIDLPYLEFLKSTKFYNFDPSWKSKAGGLSTIEAVSTDENDMGGLFIRKMAGVAGLIYHGQKLIPVLFFESNWSRGYFHPLLYTSVLGNISLIAFYYKFMEDFKLVHADLFILLLMGLLATETIVILFHLLVQKITKPKAFKSFPKNKSPSSIPSRIVMRTVLIISGVISIIAARDLFTPGVILPFLPRDDIYLEWTNAFLHSPPIDSPEYEQFSLEAPFYIGDLFISQLLAVYLLLNCLFKFVSAFCIRMGKLADGEEKCRIIWKVQCLGDFLMVFCFRLFASAAKSASFDFRWHLMSIAYEAFILGIQAYL